jgi:hypothetical protein
MIIYVDIDDTICRSPKDINGKSIYADAKPYRNRIEQINKLYNEGHEIHYWTSRGQVTGIDWTELTKKQLAGWGCKFTSIKMNKPMYDWWIDDKSFHPENFFK